MKQYFWLKVRKLTLINIKKKTEKDVKEELSRSLKKKDEYNTVLNKIVEQVTRLDDAVRMIHHCKEKVRTQKKRLLFPCLNRVTFGKNSKM